MCKRFPAGPILTPQIAFSWANCQVFSSFLVSLTISFHSLSIPVSLSPSSIFRKHPSLQNPSGPFPDIKLFPNLQFSAFKPSYLLHLLLSLLLITFKLVFRFSSFSTLFLSLMTLITAPYQLLPSLLLPSLISAPYHFKTRLPIFLIF